MVAWLLIPGLGMTGWVMWRVLGGRRFERQLRSGATDAEVLDLPARPGAAIVSEP